MTQTDIRKAILSSLKEEQTPKTRIVFRGLFWGSILSLALILCLRSMSRDVFATNDLALCISIWTTMAVGLTLVFWPQPRIQPRGYWGALAYGRLLVGMVIVTILQLIVCPEFASMAFHSSGPFSFVGQLTHFYMSFGGMKGCMFLCGLTFTGLGAFMIFRILDRAFLQTPAKKLPGILGLSLLGQSPVIVLQALDPQGRMTFVYWIAGSLLALIIIALMMRGKNILDPSKPTTLP